MENKHCKHDAFIQQVCSAISTRSAQLAACVICAFVTLSGRLNQDVVVAIDGAIFGNYYKYAEKIEETIPLILEQPRIKLMFCKDGSGIGAAIAAALYAT